MNEKLRRFLAAEAKGWRPAEIVWLAVVFSAIFLASFLNGEGPIGTVSAVSGILCVYLTGKGKLSSFLFGVVQVTTYAWLAFQAKFYGDAILYTAYFLPMNIIGWFVWRGIVDETTGSVERRRYSLWKRALVALGTVGAIVVVGFGLRALGGNSPFVDASTSVLTIVAQYLCVRRRLEQWAIWIVVDVLTIAMWTRAFVCGEGASVATLLSWIVFLVLAIQMQIVWSRDSKVED